MKTALRGTAPAPLPGVAGGWFAAALPQPFAAPNPQFADRSRQPAPPAPGGRNGGGQGLDTWLLDKLFGPR